MHNKSLVKERAGAVRPKAEEKREPVYRVVALNAPNPSLLLRLIEVGEKESGISLHKKEVGEIPPET